MVDPPQEERSISIGDPSVVALFGGTPSLSGVSVNQTSALGLSAVWRCVNLISGTISTLPLRTIRTLPDGSTQRVKSWLDTPAGVDGPTTHEWVEGIVVSLLMQGNWFGLKVFGGAGQLLALQTIPSQCVSVEVKNGRKVYRVQLDNGSTQDLTDRDIVHIPAFSLDGVVGLSPISVARISLGTSIAGERSAARLFQSGALMSAIATVDDELSEEDAKSIKEGLDRRISGESNAGQIALINRPVRITPWSVSPSDAEFLESRRFQVSEVARWFGCPPHLIGDVERSTSWGQGISEQTLAWQKFCLQQWTSRIEARLSRLLPSDHKCEFEYRRLLQGTPSEEIDILLKQLEKGVLTVNEVRAILNRPALDTTVPDAE